jgi:hypothetical protein
MDAQVYHTLLVTTTDNLDGTMFSVNASYCRVLLTPFWSTKHSTRTAAVLSGQARTVRDQGPDGPRVRRGGGRSPAAPGSRSREGPRRGGEILGVV